jgi:hypothetical protein
LFGGFFINKTEITNKFPRFEFAGVLGIAIIGGF